MNTITTKIIEEVRNRTCLDAIDTEIFVEFLKASLNEAFDAGYESGYDDGYENGYADCNAKNH